MFNHGTMSALNEALAAGPTAVAQQVRAVIEMSGEHRSHRSSNPRLTRTISVQQARLWTLAQLGPALSTRQIRALLQEANTIENPTVRLPLMVRLAQHLPPHIMRTTVLQNVWETIGAINDSEALADTLFEMAPLLLLVPHQSQPVSPLGQLINMAVSMHSIDARVRAFIALHHHMTDTQRSVQAEQLLRDIEEQRNDSLSAKSLAALVPNLPVSLIPQSLRMSEAINSLPERAHALGAHARIAPEDDRTALLHQVLDVITRIESEDECADALILLGVDLDAISEHTTLDPALLNRLTNITMKLTRRHLRARVMVMLADYLPSDLLGEAIAAINSLDEERERALLLAQIAPALPPDMIVASLAVAHSMREHDNRAQALSGLAMFAPSGASRQTMLDALAAAANLPHQFERVQTLVRMLSSLPAELHAEAIDNALNMTRAINNSAARARAIALLADYLDHNRIHELIDLANKLNDPEYRLHAFTALLPIIKPGGHDRIIDQLMEDAATLTIDYKRARAMMMLAPYLPTDSLHRLAETASEFGDAVDRAGVYIALAQNLPRDARAKYVQRAWSELKNIEHGYDRASVLATLAPLLPEQVHHALDNMIVQTLMAIDDEYDRASALTTLAPLLTDQSAAERVTTLPDIFTALERGMLASLSISDSIKRYEMLQRGVDIWRSMGNPDRSFALWKILLRHMSAMSLPDTLLCLGALMPLVHQFATEKRFMEVAQLLGVR